MIQPFGINGLKDEYKKNANDAKQPNPDLAELSKTIFAYYSFCTQIDVVNWHGLKQYLQMMFDNDLFHYFENKI